MLPGKLRDATDTRDVDHNRTLLHTAFGKQTEECGGDKVHREHVYLVQFCPLFGSLVTKHCHSKRLWICMLRCVFPVQESGYGADLPSAGVLVRFEPQEGDKGFTC